MINNNGIDPNSFNLTCEETTALSEIFSIFADPTRISIVSALFGKELSVSDIYTTINLSQSATSHQLKLLKAARIVKCRREGRNILYSLDDRHVSSILIQGIHHIRKVDCDD